ncbi:MAG: TIGR00282 family metallophosphoesterase [Candidatus Omnitrophota bacterium]
MKEKVKILAIGDITGKPGREAVRKLIPKIKKEEHIDFVIGNAENAAGGSGITKEVCDELLQSGLDVLTSGDHIWKKKEVLDIINVETRLLRPLNFPEGAPGRGAYIYEPVEGISVCVINLIGRVFMNTLDCPFRTIRKELERIKDKTPLIIVDFHAEATSEKIAMGHFLDGLVSAVLGTHTHVQTADEKILPKGTAYITDLGMTGPYDSVIGRTVEEILERFITQLPTRFQVAENDIQLHGVIVEIETKTGRACSIQRIQRKL